MCQHDVKVFCTLGITAESGDAEGFGIVFAEAQAMEVPVVSFASGGIPEAVEDEVSGLLASERDWVTLARHLKTLLTDDATWRRFSLAARERVCLKFNLKHQTALLENIYDKVIEEWNSGAGRSLNQRMQH
jgi:colanic acid/amylovoran biosynthesis glycosyltransferase